MKIKPKDSLLAIKAIMFAPGLNESDRKVGAAIIEHFNRETERCDPSLGRLSRLLEIGTRTVMRSMVRLEKEGILRRRRHGGYGGRNAYEPNWPRLEALNEDWNHRFAADRALRRHKVSPAPRQNGHVGQDASVTQTSGINLLKGTSRGPSKGRPALSVALPQSRAAAWSAAERRWNGDLVDNFGGYGSGYAEVTELIDPSLSAQATEAELGKRGAGLWAILNELHRRSGAPPTQPGSGIPAEFDGSSQGPLPLAVVSHPGHPPEILPQTKVDTVDKG